MRVPVAQKIAARTVCRWLSPDQHGDCQTWIDNDRRLRYLLAQLEALGAAVVGAMITDEPDYTRIAITALRSLVE